MKHEAVIALGILAAWLITFAVIAGVSVWRGARKKQEREEIGRLPQDARSENHNTQIQAMREWLLVPKIVKTMCQTGVAAPLGLQVLLDDIAMIEEDELAFTVGHLLSNRDVRRVVAAYHCAKNPGDDRDKVLQALMLWVEASKKLREKAEAPAPAEQRSA